VSVQSVTNGLFDTMDNAATLTGFVFWVACVVYWREFRAWRKWRRDL
jgi:hypothetical protein